MPEKPDAASSPRPLPPASSDNHTQSAATSATNGTGDAALNAAATSDRDAPPAQSLSQHSSDTPICPPRRSTFVEIINCFFSFATLVVLVTTLYVVNGQLNVYNGQLEQARHTASFNTFTSLHDNAITLEDRIYDPKSIFSIANDTECHNMPPLTDQDHIDVRRVFGHFEMYFDAWRLHLVDNDEWNSACQNAHNLLSYSCLLKNEWIIVLRDNIEPSFRSKFEPCVP